jgi:hypothetical protein
MLQIPNIERLRVGALFLSWPQGLLPLVEVRSPPAKFDARITGKTKEPALHTETAKALSDKGLLLLELGRLRGGKPPASFANRT